MTTPFTNPSLPREEPPDDLLTQALEEYDDDAFTFEYHLELTRPENADTLIEQHYDVVCHATPCTLFDPEVSAPWWNHCSKSELEENISSHLTICPGPLSIRSLHALTYRFEELS